MCKIKKVIFSSHVQPGMNSSHFSPKFHVAFNEFVPDCTWLICQVQKYIQVQKNEVQVQVYTSVTYGWDAAADFFLACDFRQNTAIRFTDSGWGSEFREKAVFLWCLFHRKWVLFCHFILFFHWDGLQKSVLEVFKPIRNSFQLLKMGLKWVHFECRLNVASFWWIRLN